MFGDRDCVLLARNRETTFEPRLMQETGLFQGLGLSDDSAAKWQQARVATAARREQIRATADANFCKVLKAFQNCGLSEDGLTGTTGYGYGDMAREGLDRLAAEVFGGEAGAVRMQWVSGTHAIASALRGNLRPGNTLLCATGAPYDTLAPVIGYPKEYEGSLRSFGIHYKELPLQNEKIDLQGLRASLDSTTKVVFLQRSRGYTWRDSLNVQELSEATQVVREVVGQQACILVDNCYGEMVELQEPTDLGADLVIGSLIKNLGATIVSTGAYVAGSSKAVEATLTGFTAPGLGGHVGPTLGIARSMAQAFSLAPQTVAQSLEGMVVASWLLEDAGFETSPRWDAPRTDTIQAVKLGSIARQRAFCKAVQSVGLVDSRATPTSVIQPGYRDPILMAGGTFIQGSSAELSADGPEREPYACYLQGGTARIHTEIAALKAIEALAELKQEAHA